MNPLDPALVIGGIAAIMVVLSGVQFATMASDKRAARRGHHRVPETTLHLVDLLGGWPGGLIAQRVLHHKTRKASFQTAFWLTVVANVVVVVVSARILLGTS